jgi:hypothetical protein
MESSCCSSRQPSWRNGTIEKFNDHWQQKFLGRTHLQSFEHLHAAAREFDSKRNSRWRYTKTGGLTPNEALRQANAQLTYEYVVATIDVAQQQLQVRLDQKTLATYPYRLE